MTIKEILYELIKPWLKPQIYIGEVVKVDWEKRSCDVLVSAGYTMFDVKLRSVIDDNKNGVCCKPKLKSLVTVAIINNLDMNGTVIKFSEIEEIEIINTNFSFKVDANGVAMFNDGNNKGIPKIDQLEREINKIHANINILKTATLTVAGVTEGITGLTGIYAGAVATLQPAITNDIANPKLKH
jgi:hypothetical protein